MPIQPPRRSSLFLLELIIAILFFSLAAAVCVRFFVKSHTLETQSIELNHAVTLATSAAEIFRGSEEPYALLQEQFPLLEMQTDGCRIYFDGDWSPCTLEHAVYSLSLQTEYTEAFLRAHINVYKGETSLYILTIENYLEAGL